MSDHHVSALARIARAIESASPHSLASAGVVTCRRNVSVRVVRMATSAGSAFSPPETGMYCDSCCMVHSSR